MKRLEKDIANYLKGQRLEFSYPLDLRNLSPFALKALRIIRTIPYGETRSYSWVAKKLGSKKFSRAVGQALARNPLPIIIPCHRIIRSNGDIGGFTGGTLLKKKLLEIENSMFSKFQAA